MKRFFLLVSPLFLLSSFHVAHATIKKLSLFEKDGRSILVAGDSEIGIQFASRLHEEPIKMDSIHKSILLAYLQRLAQTDQSFLCLLNSYKKFFSDDDIVGAAPSSDTAQDRVFYRGIDVELPEYAQKKTWHDGALRFQPWDLRDEILTSLTQFILNVKDVLPKYCGPCSSNCKGQILMLTTSQLKEFKLGTSHVSVQRYLERLDQFSHTKMSADQEQKFSKYVLDARTFFLNQEKKIIGDALIAIWKDPQKGLRFLLDQAETWMYPLSTLMAEVSLEDAVSKIGHESNVLAVVTESFVSTLRNLLKQQGFIEKYTVPLEITAEKMRDELHKLVSKPGLEHNLIHLCDECKKVADQHCPCGQAHYCSKTCQKIGWKNNHKEICQAKK